MALNKYSKTNNNTVIMGTLSGMVTLAISLWVFDKIISAVAPSFWSCGTGFLINDSTVTLGQAICYNATNASDTVAASGGYFVDATSFLGDLLPVIGIIAAYMMIRSALKKMSM